MVSVDCGTGVVGGPASAFLSGTDRCMDFAGEVAFGVTSLADIAGDVAVRRTSPAVSGAASLVDFAEVVTVEVTPSAVAGVAPPADLSGVVTVVSTVVVTWPMLGWHP